MRPEHRIVVSLPLTELWDDVGSVDAVRVRSVGVNDVRDLLRQQPDLAFVVADIGRPLRWVAPPDRFGFWKDELSPRLVEPPASGFHPGEMPDGVAYTADEWEASDGRTLVVAKAHH